jgi:hypothetical protein
VAQTGELARPALAADDGGRRAATRLCKPLRMTESCCRTDRLGYDDFDTETRERRAGGPLDLRATSEGRRHVAEANYRTFYF